MRKIGINLHATKGLTDGEYISQMAQLGFDACFSGVMEPADQIKVADLLAKHGIAYETLHAPFCLFLFLLVNQKVPLPT